ncbi:MAG: hypothetical protein U9R66_04540 [Thermodesulfobacteriota bacterium]|nr:hypothetical protein [Thermodesulfobacteriota bacterium]
MAQDTFIIQVDCYAGYRGEETPRRFTMDTRTIEIAGILDRWLAPDHRYFKVRDDDNCVYIIRHDTVMDNWELTMFDKTVRCNF